jgi:hypothetical protein
MADVKSPTSICAARAIGAPAGGRHADRPRRPRLGQRSGFGGEALRATASRSAASPREQARGRTSAFAPAIEGFVLAPPRAASRPADAHRAAGDGLKELQLDFDCSGTRTAPRARSRRSLRADRPDLGEIACRCKRGRRRRAVLAAIDEGDSCARDQQGGLGGAGW